jgi:hypothetical protein
MNTCIKTLKVRVKDSDVLFSVKVVIALGKKLMTVLQPLLEPLLTVKMKSFKNIDDLMADLNAQANSAGFLLRGNFGTNI